MTTTLHTELVHDGQLLSDDAGAARWRIVRDIEADGWQLARASNGPHLAIPARVWATLEAAQFMALALEAHDREIQRHIAIKWEDDQS